MKRSTLAITFASLLATPVLPISSLQRHGASFLGAGSSVLATRALMIKLHAFRYLSQQTRLNILAGAGALGYLTTYYYLDAYTPQTKLKNAQALIDTLEASPLLEQFSQAHAMKTKEAILFRCDKEEIKSLTSMALDLKENAQLALEMLCYAHADSNDAAFIAQCNETRKKVDGLIKQINSIHNFAIFMQHYRTLNKTMQQVDPLLNAAVHTKALELFPDSEWPLVLFKKHIASLALGLENLKNDIEKTTWLYDPFITPCYFLICTNVTTTREKIAHVIATLLREHKDDYQTQLAAYNRDLENKEYVARIEKARSEELALERQKENDRKQEAARAHQLEQERLRLEQEKILLEEARKHRREGRKERADLLHHDVEHEKNEIERDKNERKYA
jgi:hypothetical protein